MAVAVVIKRCCACKTEKPASEFYRCASSPDGLFYQCKDCKREAATRYNRSSKGRALYAKHRNSPYRLWQRRAWDKVKEAVERGAIPPARELACAHCGNQAQEYHHYLGYAPEHHLHVIPLCADCHKD